MPTKRNIKFEERVIEMISLFGLLDYDVRVLPSEESSPSYYACCSYDPLDINGDSRTATIYYDAESLEKQDNLFINSLAMHEVLELLLCRIRNLAEKRRLKITDREIDGEVHRIINILINLFLGDVVKKVKT